MSQQGHEWRTGQMADICEQPAAVLLLGLQHECCRHVCLQVRAVYFSCAAMGSYKCAHT